MLFSSFFAMGENVTKGRSGPKAWASSAQCKDTVQLPRGSYLSFAVSERSLRSGPKTWGNWFEQHDKIDVLCQETAIEWGSYSVSLSPQA